MQATRILPQLGYTLASTCYNKLVNIKKHSKFFFNIVSPNNVIIAIHTQGFLRRFRDPIWVPRISNRVPRIRENYHRVAKIRENRVPRIREIGSLQIHTGFLTFSFKKTCILIQNY